jgi:calcium/calmodulin-dependent protein kinase I
MASPFQQAAAAAPNGAVRPGQPQQAQIQPCRYKTGKTLGAGSYSVVKECVHIDTGRYYAAKVINKRLMAGREHMVRNEIAVLKKVSMGHRNILTLVDYFETMNNCMWNENKLVSSRLERMRLAKDLVSNHPQCTW